MTEPTQTMTAVKTKTVTRTQMAVALACLGASIIAAAAMSIAGNNASTVCVSNAKINVALTLGQGELISACGGQLIASTPKFSQLLVRNYNDEVLTLLVDKKYVTFKVGEGYKKVGKPVGDVPGYQQNLYVEYSGKVDKKADIVLYYGLPMGEKGVYCSDNDESQQNYDGSSIKDFQFINPYVKGTVTYYNEEWDEIAPIEDVCVAYGYGYYGSPATTSTNYLYENYCSTADGGKQLGQTIICEGGCVDGACVYVAPPKVGTMDMVSGGKLATNKLKAGENEVAKLSFTAANEDISINQLIFTFDPAGNFKPEQIGDIVLKDSVGKIVAGPKFFQLNSLGGPKYTVLFASSSLFTLSSATNEPQNYSLYATVSDPALLYDSTSGFRVSIDPQKDVTAVGAKTQSSIKPVNKKLIAWQTMYGAGQPVLTVSSSTPYSSVQLFVPGATVEFLDITLANSNSEDVSVESIKFYQSSYFASPSDLLNLWLEDEAGNVISQDCVPFDKTPVIQMKKGGLTIPGNQTKIVRLRGTVAQMAPFGGAISGDKIAYSLEWKENVKAKLAVSGSEVKVELKGWENGTQLFSGGYIFKAYPIIKEKIDYANSKLSNGTRDLLTFQVTAVGNDISLYRFDFYIETSEAELSNLYLYDITNWNNELVLNATPGSIVSNVWSTKGSDWKTNFDASQVTVSKNTPRTFVLRGNVFGVHTGSAISTKLVGPKMTKYLPESKMWSAQQIDTFYPFNYSTTVIWSDRSAASHSILSNDWTNAVPPILPKNGGQFQTLVY